MGEQSMRTPRWLFDHLNGLYGPFVADAAASEKNALCSAFFDGSPGHCGLAGVWRDPTFCNPPFRHTGMFVRKAYQEWRDRACRSVLIVPVGCSQSWFHRFVLPAVADGVGMIRYPTPRISFDRPDGTPTTQADRDVMIIGFGYPGKVEPMDLRELRP